MLVVLAGLPGVGKSTLARALAARREVTVIDKDRLRDAIFPPSEVDYSDRQNVLATEVAFLVIAYILEKSPDKTIILDGKPFSRQAQREEARSIAARAGSGFRLIHCVAPDEVVRKRLEAEATREVRNLVADRTFAKYLRIKNAFESVIMPHLVIDTSGDLEAEVEALLRYLDQPDREP
jgi:predicted kinase